MGSVSRYDLEVGAATVAGFGPAVSAVCDAARIAVLAPDAVAPSTAHDNLVRAFDRFRLAIGGQLDEQEGVGTLLQRVLAAQHDQLDRPVPHPGNRPVRGPIR